MATSQSSFVYCLPSILFTYASDPRRILKGIPVDFSNCHSFSQIRPSRSVYSDRLNLRISHAVGKGIFFFNVSQVEKCFGEKSMGAVNGVFDPCAITLLNNKKVQARNNLKNRCTGCMGFVL